MPSLIVTCYVVFSSDPCMAYSFLKENGRGLDLGSWEVGVVVTWTGSGERGNSRCNI